MSDHLSTYAFMNADERTKKLLDRLKDPGLTSKEKREIVLQAIFHSFLDGHELAVETGSMMSSDPRFDD